MFPSEGSTVAWSVSLLITNLSRKKVNETYPFLPMFPLINVGKQELQKQEDTEVLVSLIKASST